MSDGYDIIWLDADGIVHIRNSERGTLDKCPQRWWWSWREGLRPKETAQPLWFGSAIHEALADYYRPGIKRSKDFIDKFREYADMEEEYVRLNLGGPADEEKWVDARTLGEQMLLGYAKHYGGDKTWDVIATEQSFEVRIPWLTDKNITAMPINEQFVARLLRDTADFETDFFILNGTFDGVYREKRDKRIKLMEHKTAASISVGHLTMDNQSGTYHLVAQTVGRSQGWLGPKDNIKEITYNFLRKGLPDERPTDAKGYVTNKPTKDHFILAIEEHDGDTDIWPVTKTGNVKFPTVAVLEEMATERGLVVLGDRSARQPPPLYMRHPSRKTPAMRQTQLERVKIDVTQMAMYVVGFQPVKKNAGRDTCPMCPYKDMCELHETGAGWTEFRDSMFRREDLYATHRKSA